MIKALLRDNVLINPIGRNLILFLNLFTKKAAWLTSYYRVFGVVKLNVEQIVFKIYSLADDHIANDLFYKNKYEVHEFRLLKKLCKRSCYFIDVGANTGIFSMYVATLKSDIHVLSFEPHPGNFFRLVKNISINSLNNIMPFQMAIGEQRGSIDFTIPNDNSLSTTSSVVKDFTVNFHEGSYKTLSVEQNTLDQVLNSYPLTTDDIIKIDVEYYEMNVLRGAHRILTEIKPLFLLEVLRYENLIDQFPKMKGKINENHALQIQTLFTSYGYAPYLIEKDGLRLVDSVLVDHGSRNFLFAHSTKSLVNGD